MRTLNLKDLSEFNDMLELMQKAIVQQKDCHKLLYSESSTYRMMTDAAFRGAKILKRIIDEDA